MNTQQELVVTATATPETQKHYTNFVQTGRNYRETILITTEHLLLQPQLNIFDVFPK